MQSRARSQAPEVIISFFSEPSEWNSKFYIAFTCESYFELIDFIVEFTGISRDEIEVDIAPAIVIGMPTERIYEGECDGGFSEFIIGYVDDEYHF